MIAWVLMRDDDNRLPARFGVAVTLPEGAIALPRHADFASLVGMMRVEGAWVARPRPALTLDQTATASVTLSGAPAGSTVAIIDCDTNEVLLAATTTDEVWTLPDPGHYAIEVTPPLPWAPVGLRVEVAP